MRGVMSAGRVAVVTAVLLYLATAASAEGQSGDKDNVQEAGGRGDSS